LWLTKYLVEELTDTTVVTVSHDRAFLNEVCTHIIWMRHGKLYATEKTAVNDAFTVLVAEPINRLAFLLLLFPLAGFRQPPIISNGWAVSLLRLT
jgi:ABC-type sulfate/molybdate transport systems ATPase subunit